MTQADKGRISHGAHSLQDVEQIARLMRYSRDGSLSAKSRAIIKGYVLDQLGVGQPTPADEKVATGSAAGPLKATETLTHLPVKSTATTDALAQKEKAGAVAAVTFPSPPKSDDDLFSQIEMKVRHLVEADADWKLVEPLVTEMIKLRTDNKVVAKVAELAFLRAQQTELEHFFVNYRTLLANSWLDVHEAVRTHLIVRFWRSGSAHILGPVIYGYKDSKDLLPVERLFVLHTLTTAKDASIPWIYFKHNRSEIERAVRSFGRHVGMSENRFYLEIGKVAFDLGFDKDGRALFERISHNSIEHEDALHLVLQSNAERSKPGKSDYSELLLCESHASERLRVFAEFFDNTRRLGGFRDRNRPELNELLEKPMEWLQANPENLRKLSEIIISNRDLEQMLPNLFSVFNDNALKFHSQDSELALWNGLSDIEPLNARDKFWKAIGYLHRYANTGSGNEEVLWRAKALIVEARDGMGAPLLYEWRLLHETVYSWVAKSPYLIETERLKMLAQLRIAITPEFLVLGDIVDYLKSADQINLEVADHLIRLCREKRAPEVELRALNKRALSSHFTNEQLNRVWQIATASNDYDLAWRTASVINARGYLHPSVRHPWEFSGEKRTAYPLNALNKKVVAVCARGLPPAAQKICWALINIGGVLPELLACIDRGSSSSRYGSYPSDSIERKADDSLNALGWLPSPKRRYKFSFSATSGLSKVPAFAQVLPSNLWSIIVAHLSERLGINSFQWKMSSLHDQIVDLIPRMAGRQDMRRHSTKVAAWLKDLGPEQRSAWHDLASLSRTMDDERARDALAVFVTRLATLIFQNHTMAIQSLHAMRASVYVLWMLESWILGDEYRAVRKELGFESRVPVPNMLLKMDSILIRP